MRTFFLNFEKFHNRYEKHSTSNGKIITYTIPFHIFGNTKAKFNMKLFVKCLVPPKGFENQLLVLSTNVDGRGSQKYYQDCKRESNYILNPYKLSIEPISYEKEFFIGVIEKEGYSPVFFKHEEIKEKPVAVETSVNGKKSNYFKIDGKYYLAKGDPLKDVASGQTEEIKEKTLDTLSTYPFYFKDTSDAEKLIPKGFYKGYAPLYYYADKLLFEKSYHKGKKIIVSENDKKGRFPHYAYSKVTGFDTANQFIYAFKDEYPEIQQLLKIYSEEVMGEKLDEFPEGTSIIVANPDSKHKKLKNIEGVVIGKHYDKVKVSFLDYFTETLSPKELIEKEA